MIKKTAFWILAILITLFTAIYQRLTGPTHPKRYILELDGNPYRFSLPRSSNGTSDCEIRIEINDPEMTGIVRYKRYKVDEPYDTLAMQRQGDFLTAILPGQPPAGKLEYTLGLMKGERVIWDTSGESVIIRFKNNVPSYILIPHVLFIFAAMLVSTLSGLFALGNIPSYRFYAGLTVICFLLGGMILGPVVQKFAFGEFWTGFPRGKDLTDNKALIATLFWIVAWAGNRRSNRKYLVIFAAVVNIAVGLIPHSARGSELDYHTGEIRTGMIYISSLF